MIGQLKHAPLKSVADSVKASPSKDDKIKLFVEKENERSRFNDGIPKEEADSIRIITFNVHEFRHATRNESNVDDLIADIQQMNGTIMILQEVLKKNYPERPDFDQKMLNLGYRFQWEGSDPSGFLGNVFYSKLPLQNTQVHLLGHTRTLIRADIGDVMTIYGTHLDHTDFNIRREQAEAILKIIPANS